MQNREILENMGYEASIIFDSPEYDQAIVGVTDEGSVVYEYEAMVEGLVEKQGMTEEEAIE